MAAADGSAVGAGRPQPLPDRIGRHRGGTHGGPVQKQLEQAFEQCRVAEAMSTDHGTPWWSTYTPTGRTQLSLWLMRQGIRLHWGGIRHPQTQGKVERFQGSLQRAWEWRDTTGKPGSMPTAGSTTI
jgi:transposase InsO family protein